MADYLMTGLAVLGGLVTIIMLTIVAKMRDPRMMAATLIICAAAGAGGYWAASIT